MQQVFRRAAPADGQALALALNISLLVAGLVMTSALAAIDLTPRQAAAYPFVLGGWGDMAVREWGLVVLLGILIAVYSACVAKAYQVAAPAVVGTFDYAYLVFAALWGFVLFAEVPDDATLIGMVLIAGAGFLVVRPPGPRASARRPLAKPRAGRL